jgi:hypothetical protein
MVIKGDRHANSIANYRIPADHRRDPRSLPGRWRWCDRPWPCDAQKASALHTLIRQRHPTPSCGGHAPTAERTMNPARMCLESLDRRPGIREQPGSRATVWSVASHFRFSPNIGPNQIASACLKTANNGLMHRSKTRPYSIHRTRVWRVWTKSPNSRGYCRAPWRSMARHGRRRWAPLLLRRGAMMRRPPIRSNRQSRETLRPCTTPRGRCLRFGRVVRLPVVRNTASLSTTRPFRVGQRVVPLAGDEVRDHPD